VIYWLRLNFLDHPVRAKAHLSTCHSCVKTIEYRETLSRDAIKAFLTKQTVS